MTETFRQSIRPYVSLGKQLAFFVAALSIGGFIVVSWKNFTVETAKNFALFLILGVGIAFAVMTLLGLVVSLIWTVKIDRHGIAASNFFGWPKRVAWEAIESFRPDLSTGIPYYVIQAEGHRLDLWLPAELKESERFEALVIQYAGEDHPLSDWFIPFDDEDFDDEDAL